MVKYVTFWVERYIVSNTIPNVKGSTTHLTSRERKNERLSERKKDRERKKRKIEREKKERKFEREKKKERLREKERKQTIEFKNKHAYFLYEWEWIQFIFQSLLF